jgi:type I restriction enzyme S subunit
MTSRKYKIGELGKVVTGKTPSTGKPEYWSGDYPFITIPDLTDLPFVEYSTRSLSESGAAAIKSQLLPENSVLMSCIATIGKCGITTKPSFTNQQINAVIPNEKVNPLFLLYLFRNLGVEMTKYGSGGTVYSNISKSLFESIEVEIPESLNTQLAIANVLASLDAKIAINKAHSNTLEEIAQTIFKSWFIDFDPVKAKMAGEMPAGMDDATAALFPDSMEESELGPIPKGWKVSNLDSLSFVRYGAPFASKLFNTTKVGLPLIRIRDLKKQSISTWSSENHTKGFLVSGGELLIGMDGEFNPTIWFGEDALVNQRICKIEPKDFVSNFFLYFTLLPIMRRIEHGSTGSTVIHLGKTDIDIIKVAEPSQKILAVYKSIVEPMLRQMVSLNIQTRILQQARDSLLPRLISGELQIPEEMLAS